MIRNVQTNTAIETADRITNELLKALAMSLIPQMIEFYESEYGKKLFEEYMAKKNDTPQVA